MDQINHPWIVPWAVCIKPSRSSPPRKSTTIRKHTNRCGMCNQIWRQCAGTSEQNADVCTLCLSCLCQNALQLIPYLRAVWSRRIEELRAEVRADCVHPRVHCDDQHHRVFWHSYACVCAQLATISFVAGADLSGAAPVALVTYTGQSALLAIKSIRKLLVAGYAPPSAQRVWLQLRSNV